MTAQAFILEIERVERAVRRATHELDEMRASARGHCCPTCFHGAAFATAADAQERRRAWLAILLKKRAGRENAARDFDGRPT